MYSEAQEKAAKCLGGMDADAGLLHYQLAKEINNADRMCRNAGGSLRSRQVIAAIIAAWVGKNPEAVPYGEQLWK